MNRGKKLLYEEEVEDEDRIEERLSRSFVDKSRSDVFLPTELDIEEKKIIHRVKKLELEERMVEEENKQRAAEEAHRIERVKQLRSRQQIMDKRMRRSQRFIALREKERETERRLGEKVKAQIEFDKRLSLLS